MATKTRQLADFLVAGGVSDAEIQSVPHIRPGLLYPSYVASGTSNKLLDGTTSHSGAFGTAQSDGRKYYYTNIVGSKPIKDPRIGAHFGAQRYRWSSVQFLEEETAMHSGTQPTLADKVWSIDGRENQRAVGDINAVNGTSGALIQLGASTSSFFEITGYFNAAFINAMQNDSHRTIKVEVDGVTAHATFSPNSGVKNSPLLARFHNGGTSFNIDLTSASSLSSDTTLGIHTLKLSYVSGTNYYYGIELIAQDTGTTTRRSHINIPAQNVVSYGKKFSIGSDTLTNAVHKHYNPFAFKTDGTTAWASGAHNGTSWPIGTGSSTNIDTATSLGLEKWKHSGNYYKPYNGGRVVKWIANDGTIKTSVTVMPPNGKSMADTSLNAKANASIANNTYLPTFEAHTSNIHEDGLSELAKTFHAREFGNGACNGGTAASGNKADLSMLSADTADTISHVMEDGVTGLGAIGVAGAGSDQGTGAYQDDNNDDCFYISFIGTGVTGKIDNTSDDTRKNKWVDIAQNMAYGSHILKTRRDAYPSSRVFIDGQELYNGTTPYTQLNEIAFHQPKKPPVPEDACIIADYMLFADFVSQGADGVEKTSKGTRFVSAIKDHFHHAADGGIGLYLSDTTVRRKCGIGCNYSDFSTENTGPALTYFGEAKAVGSHSGGYTDSVTKVIYNFDGATTNVTVSSTSGSNSGAETTSLPSAGEDCYYIYGTKTTGVLGTQIVKALGDRLGGSADDYMYHDGFDVVTPIHTSHHYQAFETPYLYEIQGGDRNMEQTNLICSHDGKTWDEVTRDTSYIGNVVFNASKDSSQNTLGNYVLDIWRGTGGNLSAAYGQKDWAIAYDRWFCLKDGWYQIFHQFHTNNSINTSDFCRILVNGVRIGQIYQADQSYVAMGMNVFASAYITRGDYVQIYGGSPGSDEESFIFQIIRLK